MKVDYPAHWAECRFEQVLNYIQPGPYIVESTDYDDSYKIPVLTAGKSFIKGYTNETAGVFSKLPVIIFDDFTTATQYVNFPFKVKSSAMKILVPTSSDLNIKFLFYLMQIMHVNTDSHKRYWIGIYSKEKVCLPPLNEQHRIVAKIEELFSELDKGVESLKKAREQLKVYRQALLKHAFEGKLTEQWRKENADKLETADQLLERIKHERESRYQQQLEEWKAAVKQWEADGKEGRKPAKPSKLLPFSTNLVNDQEKLPKLPKGWVWLHLSDAVERIQIGPFGSLLHKQDYVHNGTPLINPSHIKEMAIVPDDGLSVSAHKLSELKKYIMSKNDIVIGRRGEMGRCAVVNEREDGWLCGTGSLFVRFLKSFNAEFYCHTLRSRRVKDYLSDSSIGTTMQNLNQKILQTVPIPICCPSEQYEIVSELNWRFSVIDRALLDVEENLNKSEFLRQSILKKAFSGQLVPQDPNDEPASVLLDRIVKEKAAAAANVKKARGRKKTTNA